MEPGEDMPQSSNQTENNGRSSCKYGSLCYRKNPSHRMDEAHPGDSDYVTPPMQTSSSSAPACQYGSKCFRLNAEHINNYSHPPFTNAQANLKKYREGTLYADDSFLNDSEDEDPFQGDSGGSDYVPSDCSA